MLRGDCSLDRTAGGARHAGRRPLPAQPVCEQDQGPAGCKSGCGYRSLCLPPQNRHAAGSLCSRLTRLPLVCRWSTLHMSGEAHTVGVHEMRLPELAHSLPWSAVFIENVAPSWLGPLTPLVVALTPLPLSAVSLPARSPCTSRHRLQSAYACRTEWGVA